MAVPKRLGRWQIGKKIDGGGQGMVYRTQGAESEPEVAIKIVRLPMAKTKKRARFSREVAAHAMLSRDQAPNVVHLIDENFSDGDLEDGWGYLVMPLAHTTLAKTVKTFHGRTEFALESLRGIVNGVANAHAKGAIHRDIKSENILFLDAELREPVIADFGCCFLKAEREDRITDVNETVGSKFFMSREQYLAGPSDVTPAANVYGLGKVLVFMLTGHLMARESSPGRS